MKKQFTLLLMLAFSMTIFAQEVIVEWNFPDEGADSIADGGIAQNLDKPIYTLGGTSNLNYKNGATTKAAQATHWDEGAETKCWVVELNTENYGSLLLSSKLSSGGNDPGPRDFRVDYKIGDDGTWAEVPNSEITTANDWETGVLQDLPLPETCGNQPLVYLRWIMTSNTASNGEPVASNGKLKIDDIIVSGIESSSVGESSVPEILVYPNPFKNEVYLKNIPPHNTMRVFNLSGKLVYENEIRGMGSVNLSRLKSGVYEIQLIDKNGIAIFSARIVKQ